MNQFRSFTADDAVRVAEAALSRSGAGPFVVTDVSDIGGTERRNLILRASATDASGVVRSIIIKATRAAGYDPAAQNVYRTSGLVKEWAATKLLARQLAADVAQGVLVFEDLGEHLASLVRPLLHGSAAEAEHDLIAYAVALARLHGGTIGCQDRHRQIVRSIFPAATVPPPGEGWIDREPGKVIALLGGRIPEDELILLAERLRSPGQWMTLVHRDPCPDNVLLAADGTAKLIDFEFASPGHALIDVAYWRMGFPTCWCAGGVPESVSARLDFSYHAALADYMRVDRDALQRELAIISVIWLFGSLAWKLEDALKEDTEWGISTERARILHHFECAIEMSAGADVLSGTRLVASEWLDALRNKWPGSAPLALYPAFAMPA